MKESVMLCIYSCVFLSDIVTYKLIKYYSILRSVTRVIMAYEKFDRRKKYH